MKNKLFAKPLSLLILVVLFGLAACSKQEENIATDSDTTNTQQLITNEVSLPEESMAMVEKLQNLQLDQLGNPQIKSDAVPPVTSTVELSLIHI